MAELGTNPGLNAQIVDEGTAMNAKVVFDALQHAFIQGVQAANRATDRMTLLAESELTNALDQKRAVSALTIKKLMDTSAEQAQAFSNEMAANINNKLSELASNQQAGKIANTTSPQTGAASGWDIGVNLQQQIVSFAATLAALEARMTAAKL